MNQLDTCTNLSIEGHVLKPTEPRRPSPSGAAGALTPLEEFRPKPGQRVLALSSGCVAHCESASVTSWPELEQGLHEVHHHPDALCWLALPADLDALTALAVCRAAHEVWVTEEEIAHSPMARTLLRFRTESAPPSLGERKSVLHAPEVGCVRLWRQEGLRLVASHVHQPDESQTGDLSNRLRLVAAMMCRHQCASPENWMQMASTLRQHADRLRHRVRVSLAALFALTSIGMIGLQLLGMSSLNIPMADLYSVFFLWVGAVYLWGRRLHWNEMQLAWHALAEALDIQAMLSRAGLKDGTITALYLLRHRRQVEWIREALRPMTWAAYRFAPSTVQSALHVLDDWVPKALDQHQDMARRQSAKAAWLNRGMKTCYGLGGALTVLAMSGLVSSSAGSAAVSAGIGVTSSLGTLLLIFNGVLGFAQDAALHRHLHAVFAQAQRCLGREMAAHEYDELLVDLGQECVQLAAERTLL